MRNWLLFTVIGGFVSFPSIAQADEIDKWTGTYTTTERNFVTVKRLTVTKDKESHLKIRGALVGFPDEVPICEATAELYADTNNRNYPDVAVVSFPSDKFKPVMIVNPRNLDGNHYTALSFTCYMRDSDGVKIHITGILKREP